MYRLVVKRKVAATFESLSSGDFDSLIGQLGDSFRYRFIGDHALGGTRSQSESMRSWFERVSRLFPELQFCPESMSVSGPPWNTTVMTHIHLSAPSGYSNEMFQKIRLRWGKITEIVTLENLDRLRSELDSLTDAGHVEASAPPIIDDDVGARQTT